MQYTDFLQKKKLVFRPSGIKVLDDDIHPLLFDFQKDLTKWAARKGRSAIFADCGLGKTFMQLEWIRLVQDKHSLIVAPLSVARQTVREARKIDLDINYTRSKSEIQPGINITNYEMLKNFSPDVFDAVVLDESSILKSLDGKTRQKVTEMFEQTSYKLCCTATPAPNDIAEIANHAEFLGIMSRNDMLATFFVHDNDGWRLKRHAKEPFYRWLASWGMSLKRPSDLGYSDEGFELPGLNIEPVIVPVNERPDDRLFWCGLKGVQERAEVRKKTLRDRVERAAELIEQSEGQWIAWCGLNEESNMLQKLIGGSVKVEGSMAAEEKARLIEAFQDGEYRVLNTKPKIAGFGMNLQNANNMVFVGLSDSYESYYQCLRRSWRFGQRNPVNAYIVLSEIEQEIHDNVIRKEREAEEMSQKLIENVKEFEKEEISEGMRQDWEYKKDDVQGDEYRLMLGDSVERMKEMDDESVHLSVYSPPFLSLYTYTPTERDIGNSKTEEEFFGHYGYIIDELLRVTLPGRNTCVHVAQVPAMLVRDGYIGMKDFRGKTIVEYEKRGWVYHGEVTIDKDPQAQAIRTKSKSLMFKQLKKDASWLRPALADHILVFRKPGDNPVPIVPDLTNDEWIQWARPIWYGIRESDTLNYSCARGEEDERHICPLQLETIRRCIRLWSNEGETVFSPFMGIGSEGYEALRLGRKFVGIELKENYFREAVKNVVGVTKEQDQLTLI